VVVGFEELFADVGPVVVPQDLDEVDVQNEHGDIEAEE